MQTSVTYDQFSRVIQIETGRSFDEVIKEWQDHETITGEWHPQVQAVEDRLRAFNTSDYGIEVTTHADGSMSASFDRERIFELFGPEGLQQLDKLEAIVASL